MREGLLLAALAERLRLPEEQVRERFLELRGQAARRGPTSIPAPHMAPETPARPNETQRLYAGRLTFSDRLECELLEILVTAPEWLGFVDSERESFTIRHPQLQVLLSEMLYLGERQPWTFERLLGALEDSELKRLAVWLDEQARAKDLAKKLRETGADSDETCPLFLRSTIENLKWRQEEQSQMQRGAPTSSIPGEGSPPPDDTELLRQASQFHLRRATKRTTA